MHRELKPFPGASPATTGRLNVARKAHSEMVEKVIAEEKKLAALEEQFGQMTRELSDLEGLRHTREALNTVKAAVDKAMAQISNNL